MTSLFLTGPLRHLPLLKLVLGRPVAVGRGALPGYSLRSTAPGHWPLLTADPQGRCEGVILRDAHPDDVACLTWLISAFGLRFMPVVLEGGLAALVVAPAQESAASGPEWVFSDWVAREASVFTAAIGDLLAMSEPTRGTARWQMMLVRASSRLRAQAPEASYLRNTPAPGALHFESVNEVYANYFAVEEYNYSHSRFDGNRSPVINRAAFISGDAATVLPYDPVRDRVLVVEQIRNGPMARGAQNPWMIEAIAGRVDPFETPEDCARREAVEEAGLTLDRLIDVARYYPSPAAKTEFLYSYVAICDLPDDLPRLGGMEGEGEDIRSHLLSFDQLLSLIAQPEMGNGPLILTVYWLAAHRERLKSGK